MLSFDLPLWLLALPAPLLLWRYNRRQVEAKKHVAILHPQTELLANLSKLSSPVTMQLPWLWLLGCMLLITAMARPQWINISDPHNYQGHHIILALDVSESMRATDYSAQQGNISRLTTAKNNAQEFIRQRAGDDIGLLVFADSAKIYSPMTTDHTILHNFIDEIDHGMIGEKTALGDSIKLAVEQLMKVDEKSRLMIIFSDGSNTAGSTSPTEATKLARRHKVRIYTIGIGHEGRVPFPRGPVAKPLYTELPMDMGLLLQIANNTGGRFSHATDSLELKNIIAAIKKQEPVTLIEAGQRIYSDHYWLPLLLGLLLIAAQELRQRLWVTPG